MKIAGFRTFPVRVDPTDPRLDGGRNSMNLTKQLIRAKQMRVWRFRRALSFGRAAKQEAVDGS